MELALLAARLLLSVVFAVAGIAKLASRQSTKEMLRDFQIPDAILDPAALALPAAELLAAIILVPASTATGGAILALLLLAIFTVAISANLIRGRRPSCQCFGALNARPVGTATLVRNGALLLVALALVASARVRTPIGAFAWFVPLSAPEKISALIASTSFIVSAVTLFVVMQLVAQNGRLLVALDALTASRDGRDASGDKSAAHGVVAAGAVSPGAAFAGSASAATASTESVPRAGLTPGTRAPDFTLPDLMARPVSLAEFRGMPTLLVFSDPKCGPCSALMPTIASWQSELRDRLRVVLVSSGSADANRAKAREHHLLQVLIQKEHEVQDLFAAFGTPTAVLIGPDGAIASYVAQGRDDILALVMPFTEQARQPGSSTASAQHQPPPHPPVQRHAPQPANALPVGTPAPMRELRDLFGQHSSIAYSRTKPTLLLFWNPDCGYCQKLLPELRAWAMKDSSAYDLVVISTGSPEANLGLGLPATVLLDHEFALGRDFHVQGTPSAIVIAPDGTVGSGLAVGGVAVMALARASASAAVA